MYSHVFWHARWVVGLTYRFLAIFFMYMHKKWIHTWYFDSLLLYTVWQNSIQIFMRYLIWDLDKISVFYYHTSLYTCTKWLVFFITVQVYILHVTNAFLTEIDIQRCVQDSIKIFCSTPKSATFRQHAREPNKPGTSSSRPNISYYSRDYNEQPKSELVKPCKHCYCTVPYWVEIWGSKVERDGLSKESIACPIIIVIII